MAAEKILVVDNDDEMLQQWLVHQLEREGYQLHLVSTGQTALEAIQTPPGPELIILSVDLPDFDGYEVAKKLQEQADTKDIPIIFLANQNTAKDKLTSFEVGGVDYLIKPLNIPELVARVKATLRQLRKERDKANRNLEEYKSNLSENMSHELLTPLNKVLNGVDILKRLTAQENETKFDSVIDMIRRGADELRWLAEDLLIINQLSEQKVGPFRQPVELVELITQLIEQTNTRYSRQPKTIKIDAPENCLVNINRRHIAHILHHLIDNAAKFSSAQEQIKIAIRPIGQAGAEIQVQDKGKGIKAELQSKVFEKFYQIDMSMTRDSGGLGLGLYIARELAHLYGGDVTLTSKPGQGTTCKLTIPDVPSDWA
jgi:signal transduction histidine kinase